MKTLEQVISSYKCDTLDARDVIRLGKFMTLEQLPKLELTWDPTSGETHTPISWTRENILEQLKGDVYFAFEKALSQRGISASLMHSVVRMWNWILEEGLENFDQYAQYGLPLFKATAVKYGFPNPIGDDIGNEEKYSSGN